MHPINCSRCHALMDGLSEICPFCEQDHSEERQEALQDACAVLYCGSCGNYLGSLGGRSCSCGWDVLSD